MTTDTVATPKLDVVTLEVLRNGFIQICEEVTITMLKTAHSVIFNEGKDLSTGVFDRDGRLIAQDMQGCPIHIAAMPQAVKAGIERYGVDAMYPGDVFLVNDSYAGGTHLPDVTVFAPVFWEGELVGFIGNRGHHTDVGGMAPGSMPGDATEMYQEGLIVPPVKIYERGRPCRDTLSIIYANVRLPRNTEGDIAAQRAGVQTGMRRFHSLLERYGLDVVRAGIDEIIGYSDRQMRSEVARIPDGTYTFVDYMDTDGLTGRRVTIALTVRKQGSEITFDFAGSDPQVQGAVNCPFSVTVASVWIAMLMVTNPDIHPSEGAFTSVHVTAPPGTVVNPRPPASTVSGLTETCNRLIDMCIAALAPGCPDRVVAGELGTCNVHTLGGVRSAGPAGSPEPWVAILNPKGGWGGMADRDGWTCIQDPLSNCRNQPCEALEHSFPLRVRRFSLRTGVEGAGRHRGGFGLVRDIEVTSDCVISTCLDRARIPPFGLLGGDDGAVNAMHVKRAGSDAFEPLPPRESNMALRAGDVVRIETAIGGGFGDPLERDPRLVAEDVREGYLPDAAAAREVYGVVLDDAGEVDEAATDALRAQLCSARGEVRPRTDFPERAPVFVPATGTGATR
ncbi:MAG: hydantoinase B/oxoprolinase family protein [Solirubrobacteraceae bacterium]|nr:hydantoinase B/oxoprolinase family protein [Solirubrobacteraceae bacterium]